MCFHKTPFSKWSVFAVAGASTIQKWIKKSVSIHLRYSSFSTCFFCLFWNIIKPNTRAISHHKLCLLSAIVKLIIQWEIERCATSSFSNVSVFETRFQIFLFSETSNFQMSPDSIVLVWTESETHLNVYGFIRKCIGVYTT